MVEYLSETEILCARSTLIPNKGQTKIGYGKNLPTGWQIQLKDKRWRRVSVICFSNSGSAFVRVKGKKLFLGSIQPNDYVKTSEAQQ